MCFPVLQVSPLAIPIIPRYYKTIIHTYDLTCNPQGITAVIVFDSVLVSKGPLDLSKCIMSVSEPIRSYDI